MNIIIRNIFFALKFLVILKAITNPQKISISTEWEPGYLSWYNDSLRPGVSGDRIPVGARFSAPSRKALRTTQPPIQ